MYENIAKVHGISRQNCVIALKRAEWQQPPDVFPPLHKRLTGQRRRRMLGAFPQTENDVGQSILLLRSQFVVFSLSRISVGEFYLTKLSTNSNVLKQAQSNHYPIDTNSLNGQWRVSTKTN